jgi:hypothetical protein
MQAEINRPLFAICVESDGVEDLTVGMLYRVLFDEAASKENLLRVIDDSGEDYLYPAERFVRVDVPEAEEQKLAAVAPANVA